ncbi:MULTISPECIES: MFS transporter [unclassified Pseudomonas]|uniref:MFS transporter n=1 Tax=unclassified Pseudomonas TaxID=196821 RepID=UPI000D3A85BE|nr:MULTISPECIES: MFS transporter [unclassified Pseudomonas]RAU47981.1 MFS transporter [Pseudomonas sp. RIT 409]RAU55325.1 MFS transporter [Pseudomonas sp. RIT 412]
MASARPALTALDSVILSICCGLSVATAYYNQAMLPLIGESFAVSSAHTGQVATATQLGYALGLLLFVPLGDRVQRRHLIMSLLAGNIASLLLCASTGSFGAALFCSVAIGVTAISAQIIIPGAMAWVEAEHRGRVLGLMVSGLSAGGLLARTVSGALGHWLGWRGMFSVAAALDLLVLLAIATRMPRSEVSSALPYGALLRSLWQLMRRYPPLWRSALCGGLLFGALNVFWGSMAGLLAQPPYGFSTLQSGLMGLSAVVGIACASTLGRLTRRYSLTLSCLGAGLVMAAFVALEFAGQMAIVPLVLVAATFIDLGNRANQLAHQTRVLALQPDAVSRLNTVFMMVYFVGGALGSSLGAAAAQHYGWPGMAVAGGVLAIAGGLCSATFARVR